jgi:AcrR family transcriptional regulator
MKYDSNSEGKEKILVASILLFAETGFDGVSMRDVAEKSGLTPAALYYHFPSKEQLYFEAVVFAFRKVAKIVADAISAASTPTAQLESVVDVASRMLAENRNILRLMQWIKLDRNEERLRRFGAAAFQDLYLTMYRLASELAPQFNPSALAVSIIGIVIFPFEAHAVFQFLPGYDDLEGSRAHFLKHVVTLLSDGFVGAPQAAKAPATSIA